MNQKLPMLKSIAHKLRPVVWIGQKGITQETLSHIDSRIRDHEIIKIKINIDDRENRKRVIEQVCTSLQLELVQYIGKTATMYRQAAQGEGKKSHIHSK